MPYKIVISVLLFIRIVIPSPDGALEESRSAKEDSGSSLVFVFDTTGSMHDDLKQLSEGAEMIMDAALEESNVISNFVFVPFHDPTVGPATVTSNKTEFKSALSRVRVRGGGDCPEKSLGGILLALNVSLPGSYVYVLTDATAGDHRLVGDVLDAVQRKQSQIVFVLTGHCNDLHRPHFKVYQRIAAASSGQVFNLNKTSVHNVLDFVRSSLKGRTVNLASAVNPAGYNFTQEIPVDNTLSEVTVSVSGAKPAIHVLDPSGQRVTGPPKLLTTLDLSEIMVVKVIQPEPGNWSITVGSEEQYSVKVVGQSNLTFRHGFSVHRPGSAAETSHRPLQGTLNYMLISLTDTEMPVKVDSAEILTVEGRTLFEVPLSPLDESGKIFLAEAFVLPEDFFYIAINGRDENNQELRRVGATAIQSKLPDPPYITAPQSLCGRRHVALTLSCHVESLVPVTVTWVRDAKRLTTSSLQSTVLEYVIADLDEDTAGTYRCVAKNNAGVSTAYTEVNLIVMSPTVTLSPANAAAYSGELVEISCTVFSEAALLSFQFGLDNHMTDVLLPVENPSDGLYVFENSVEVDDSGSGVYTCKAANKGGEANSTMHIKVQAHPVVEILGPRTLTANVQSPVQLLCDVQYANTVRWVAPNGTEMKSQHVFGRDLSELSFNVSLSDEGNWSCIGVGRNGLEARDSICLNVIMDPSVSIRGAHNLTLLYGSNYSITCDVLARPKPEKLLWRRANRQISETSIQNLQPDLYSTTLILKNVTHSSEGDYVCYAESSKVTASETITVNVRKNMTLVEGFTDQAVNLHSQLELNCKVDSYPKADINWYHNGTNLVPSDNINFLAGNTKVLITKVDFGQLGLFVCEATNGYEKMALDGVITVKDLESPLLLKEPGKIKVRRGNSTIVTCRILKGRPYPEITWLFQAESSSTFSHLPEGSTLSQDSLEVSIASVDKEHSGVYRCVADNGVGSDVYDSLLVVQYPPHFATEQDHNQSHPLEVKAGEKVTFSCQAVGVPTPLVVWTKDGKAITFTENIYLSDAQLELRNATQYDSGVYTCVAATTLGAARRNFTLVVYVPPTIPPPTTAAEQNVIEGQLVELPCAARGSPRPALEWRQNGQRIAGGGRKRIDEDFVLRFVANLTDFGEYTCVATNRYGSTSFTFSIYVWVPPYIEPPLDMEVDTVAGRNVNLSCSAVGFPIPTIVWEFEQQPLTVNTSDLSFNEFGDVFIRNASAKHSGYFTCIAENDVGVAMKAITLDVNEPPQIEADSFAGPYLATTKEASLTLPCVVSGRPAPFVGWSRDGLYIDNDERYDVNTDGSLTINFPAEELSGVYVCVAKNKAGAANRSVEVQIYSVPTPMQADQSQYTVTVVEGTNHTLECPVHVTRDYTVKWYKDGKLLKSSLLPNISRGNASLYTCSVSNAVGSATAAVTVDVQWPPRFLSPVETSLEAVQGESCTLDCAVDARPEGQTIWLFNSRPFSSEDKDHFRLAAAQLHQAGVYKCIVSNKHGTVVRQFTLDVLVPPVISQFDFLEVQLKEGSNATLDCKAVGLPTPNITWVFNNTHWRQQSDSLHIYNASIESQGLFRCDAVNKAGSAHLVYRVTVVIPAKVTEVVLYDGRKGSTVLGNVELLLNATARIACHASGNPAPRIQWLRNGNILSENAPGFPYADVVFDQMQIAQGKLYSCVVSNDGGSDERRVQLKILEPPQIFPSIFQDPAGNKTKSLEILSGQPFHLNCFAYGDPPPQILWYKDGEQVTLDSNEVETKMDEFGETLMVNKAVHGSSGNYTCVARNKGGETSFSYVVDVLVPPSAPSMLSSPVRIRQGSSLQLRCPVLGNPTPNVRWVKHPFVEMDHTVSRVQLSEDNITLSINVTETKDSGTYVCIMTNKVGATESSYSVSVELAPSSGEETVVTSLYRSVVLYCRADGHPTPEVRWYKDGKPLEPSSNIQPVLEGNVLTIWRATAEDAGRYVCVAQNSAGLGYRKILLRITVPGKWSSWALWSLCDAACGEGHQSRRRGCQFAAGDVTIRSTDADADSVWIVDESACKGAAVERRKCHMPPCEEDESLARWSGWSRWSGCSASCGVGAQTRSRRCRPPAAACRGDNVQIRKCPDLLPCHFLGVGDSENDVLNNSREEVTEPNPFIPEATFELEPESGPNYTEQNPNYPEVYSKYPERTPNYPSVYSNYPERTPNYPSVYSNYPERNPSYPEGGSNKPETEWFDVNGGKPLKVFDVILTENLNSTDDGPCEVGFKYNSDIDTCEDIDECLVDNNHCHSTQVCENMEGGYRCSCQAGYVALGVGQRCLDINECEQGTDGCQYACVNVAGGYVCACPRPMRLHTDKRRCIDVATNGKQREMEEMQDYLSATVDFPARFKIRGRN